LSTPVVLDGVLYGLSTKARGQFYAIDAKTGQVLWLGTPREADNTALVKAGQLLFFLNDDAELIVARANRKAFDPIARYVVADSATWAQPAISGERIFVKDTTSLTLWTIDDGRSERTGPTAR
jgi:glucose dehydrogenase